MLFTKIFLPLFTKNFLPLFTKVFLPLFTKVSLPLFTNFFLPLFYQNFPTTVYENFSTAALTKISLPLLTKIFLLTVADRPYRPPFFCWSSERAGTRTTQTPSWVHTATLLQAFSFTALFSSSFFLGQGLNYSYYNSFYFYSWQGLKLLLFYFWFLPRARYYSC